jgi:hypothetical protein
VCPCQAMFSNGKNKNIRIEAT